MSSVLHIIRTLDAFGGTPQKLLMQISGGSRFQHFIFCTGEPGALAGDFERAGVKVYGGRQSLLRLPLVLMEIRKIVVRHRIGVVHAHFFRSRVFAYFLQALTKVAIVVSEHGAVPERRLHVRLLDSLFLSRRVPVVCNSRATERQFLSDRWGRGATRVIYNGVRVPQVAAKRPETECDAVKFVAVGGLVVWKRYQVLLRGIRGALDRGTRLSVVIFGDGPLREDVLQEVSRLGLEAHVIVRGYAPREEVLSELASSDGYVSAATQEGFGIAAVEAMFLGRPVLLACAGAHAELLSSTSDPQYFDPDDVASLVKGFQRLCGSATLRARLGAENRQLATQRFAVSRFIGELDELYESLARPASAPRRM